MSIKTKYLSIYTPKWRHKYGVFPSYAAKGGGPVLKTEKSWRKINGIYISTKWKHVWILFRRSC